TESDALEHVLRKLRQVRRSRQSSDALNASEAKEPHRSTRQQRGAAAVDDELSRAIIEYLAMGRSPFPKADEDAVVAFAGDGAARCSHGCDISLTRRWRSTRTSTAYTVPSAMSTNPRSRNDAVISYPYAGYRARTAR